MICPTCTGTGRVRSRFLFFFERQARCHDCDGTGQYRPGRTRTSSHRTTDDWPTSHSTDSRTSSSEPSDRHDAAYLVAAGGMSGGAGGGAEWGSPTDADAPVIVDPYAEEGGQTAESESWDASDSDSSSNDDSGGTAY